MSEQEQTPADGSEDRELPNGGSGGTPPPPTLVIVQFSTATTAQPLAGLPFTVQGTASSSPAGAVTIVSLTMNGTAVPVVSDTGNWATWHAVVTPAGPGVYTLVAGVSSTPLGKTASATLQLTAVSILSAASPTPSSGPITTSTLSFTAGVAVASTLAFTVGSGSWQYQIGTGAWAQPAAVSFSGVWQLTLSLPATAVPPGTSYPLTIRATGAPNLTATLALTVQPVDKTPPVITSVTAPAEAIAGNPPATVSAQVTDKVAGQVSSGVPAQNVTFQLDGRTCPAAQSTAGDPGTWSATLPALTNAQHTLTVTATDAAGNTSTATRSISVALTSWTRLEPVPRDPTLMEGLQARVADPYWLLARQAAFGELTGQDTASPVSFRLRATSSSITRFRPARAPGTANPATGPGVLLADGPGGPLEMLAEAEAEPDTAGPPRPLFAAQAGLHYRRLLGRAAGAGNLAAYESGLLADYPFPASQPVTAAYAGVPPPATAGDPVLAPYAGRVPDGTRLYADLAAALRPPGGGTGALPASPALGGANATVVTSVARAWLAWYDAVSGQELGQHDTWIPERTEYAFSIAAPGPDAETVLAAGELDTGELDWPDFDLLASSVATAAASQVSLGAVPADVPGGDASVVIAGLPAPVTFRGMPNRAWWGFEDAAIDFGSITAPVESVTTSVLVEFAMCYGNDHFIVPIRLPIGSVLRVDSLVVTDTFGEVLQVRSVADVDGVAGSFRLFEHAVPVPADGTLARDPLFLLFPTAGEVLYGPALEEVHFVRDEAAELVWGIEETALGPDGVPADRTADALAHFLPLVPTPADGTTPPARTYVLRSDVEANWFPFLLSYPPSTPAGPAPATQLAMADVPPLAVGQPAPLPWGRILAPFAPVVPAAGGPAQPGVLMPLEEITRVGTQVVRAWRYARWTDGKQLSWVGRRARPGRGPGASGLSFDLTI